MKRFPTLFLLCLCFFTQTVHAEVEAELVERQLIVQLEADTSDTIANINSEYNTTTIGVINAAADIYLLQTEAGVDAEVLANILDPSGNGGDARIEFAEANYLSDLPEGSRQNVYAWGGQNAGPLTTQYANALHNLATAHQYSLGSGVTVAILDSGFQLDHPLLASRWTSTRYDFVDSDAVPEEVQNGNDDDGDTQVDEAFGHGTHVAGIVNQVAPQASLMPIRVLDSDGRSNLWRIGQALNFAIENGADVINLSLGTDYESEMFEYLVQEAEAANVVIVAAAGNYDNAVKQYPAAFPTVLAVSAIDSGMVRAPFANFGPWVDVVATGVSIHSSFPTDGYASWNGTSMSTPFVAGEAALLAGLSASRSSASVRDLIKDNVVNIDAQNSGYVGQLGDGLINIGSAVASSPGTPTVVTLAAQESNRPVLPLFWLALSLTIFSVFQICWSGSLATTEEIG